MGVTEKLEAFDDKRHTQGTFMRGHLNSSLAGVGW
eukprot:gene846-2225_t